MTDSVTPQPSPRERLNDLLADELLNGLTLDEQVERDQLARELGVAPRDEALEAVVNRLQSLAELADDEPLPASLRDRILADAPQHLSRPVAASSVQSNRGASISAVLNSAGWLLAIALLMAVLLRNPADSDTRDFANANERTTFTSLPESVSIDWAAGPDEAGAEATGRVVWNTDEQAGFMTFLGLPANDPTQEQYQLWIFDAEQDERYPIDGGVFDVGSEGETVVAIDPKLNVSQPTLFAITIEKPGGVVVSSRERLPLVASVPGDEDA